MLIRASCVSEAINMSSPALTAVIAAMIAAVVAISTAIVAAVDPDAVMLLL